MSPLNTLCKRLAWWGLVAQQKVIEKNRRIVHELGAQDPKISNRQFLQWPQQDDPGLLWPSHALHGTSWRLVQANEKGGGDVWYGKVCSEIGSQDTPYLGGGNSNIFYFHPENWGKIPIFINTFQMGWFNHQPDISFQYIYLYIFRIWGTRSQAKFRYTPSNQKTPWEINPCVRLRGFDVTWNPKPEHKPCKTLGSSKTKQLLSNAQWKNLRYGCFQK